MGQRNVPLKDNGGAEVQLCSMELGDWVGETKELLALEWSAENEVATAELNRLSRLALTRRGVSIADLTVSDVTTGLYGRTVVSFQGAKPQTLLNNANVFSVGDVVRLVPNNGPSDKVSPPSGIVSRVTEFSISVAFDDKDSSSGLEDLLNSEEGPLRLDRLPNDATHRKVKECVQRLEKLRGNELAQHRVIDVVFGDVHPEQAPEGALGKIEPFNENLNLSQLEAIDFALRSKDIAVIHGPPGTGKTTTVVELVAQAVCVHGLRVLVCAPSNVAVDNIAARLAVPIKPKARQGKKLKDEIRMVRVGHPARLLPSVLEHSLDAVVKRASGTEIVNDVREELNNLLKQFNGAKKRGADIRALRNEAKELRKEIRRREETVVDEIIKHSNVVLCTNVGAASLSKQTRSDVEEMRFDLVVIDEAAQAIEASCWIPILLGRGKVVLAGDHKQLPPTIKSEFAAKGLLGKTLVDRVVDKFGDRVVRMLNVQYRMHEKIMDWASKEMYGGNLIAHQSVAHRKLIELEGVSKQSANSDDAEDDDPMLSTLTLIDTAYLGLEESMEDEDEAIGMDQHGSRFNTGEAEIVELHVKSLVEHGLRPEDIAVITPYNAQVQLIRARMLETYPKLQVRSVDGFQGQEKEAVVLSLVRSNPKRNIGFLADERRLNVAVTRAKRHVCIICDSATISNNPFLSRMIEYFQQHAVLRYASDYLAIVDAPVNQPVQDGKHLNKPTEVTAERKKHFQTTVKAFLEDAQAETFVFPSDLNSKERKYVHGLAEKHQLLHTSTGEGENRSIQIAKVPNVAENVDQKDTTPLPTEDNEEQHDENFDDTKQVSNNGDGVLGEYENDFRHRNEKVQQGKFQAMIDAFVNDPSESQWTIQVASQEEKPVLHETLARMGLQLCENEDESNDVHFQRAGTKYESIRIRVKQRHKDLVKSGRSPQEAALIAVKEIKKELEDSKAEPSSEVFQASPLAPFQASDETGSPAVRPTDQLERVRKEQAERHAERRRQENAEWVGQEQDQGKRKASNKSKRKNGGSKTKPKHQGEKLKVSPVLLANKDGAVDDDMAFLDSVLEAKKKCSYIDCEKPVSLIGEVCRHCKFCYCLKHIFPEDHGCGAAAKDDARKQWISSSGQIQSPGGSGASSKLRPHQRSALKRQLGSKIAEKQEQRASMKAKAKDKDKRR